MKRMITALLLAVLSLSAIAQTTKVQVSPVKPQAETTAKQFKTSLAYQGVVKDKNGTALASGKYDVEFKLYDAAEKGKVVWSEKQNIQIEDGVISAVLGQNGKMDLPFTEQYWLSLTVNKEEMPRQMLTGSPYVAGNSVKTVNGATGDVEIVGGNGISVEKSKDGKIVIEGNGTAATGNGGKDIGYFEQATIGNIKLMGHDPANKYTIMGFQSDYDDGSTPGTPDPQGGKAITTTTIGGMIYNYGTATGYPLNNMVLYSLNRGLTLNADNSTMTLMGKKVAVNAPLNVNSGLFVGGILQTTNLTTSQSFSHPNGGVFKFISLKKDDNATFGALGTSIGSSVYGPDGSLILCSLDNKPLSLFAPGSNILMQSNVGIGTNDPKTTLDVSDPTGTPKLRLTGNKGGSIQNIGEIEFYNECGPSSLVTSSIKSKRGMNTWKSGQLEFSTSTNSNESNELLPRMLIDEFGNVGIGTSSPTAKLDVVGDVKVTNGKFIGDGSALTGLTSSQWTSNQTDLSYANGKVLIGTTATTNDEALTSKLVVNGRIVAEEIVVIPDVETNPTSGKGVTEKSWPDYVFTPEYDLMSLEQIQSYINQNKHLPGVPSREEVGKNGVNLINMQHILLKKIEELTLHMIDQQNQIVGLKNQIKK